MASRSNDLPISDGREAAVRLHRLVRRSLLQTPSRFVGNQNSMTFVAVVHDVHFLDGVDPVHREEVPHSFGEHDQLRPARSGVAPRGGNRVAVGRLYA